MARVRDTAKNLVGNVSREVLVEGIAKEIRETVKSGSKEAAKSLKAKWLGLGLYDEAAFNYELSTLGPEGTNIITDFLEDIDNKKTNLFRLIITTLETSEKRQEVLRNFCDLEPKDRLRYFEQTISKQEYINQIAKWMADNVILLIRKSTEFSEWLLSVAKNSCIPELKNAYEKALNQASQRATNSIKWAEKQYQDRKKIIWRFIWSTISLLAISVVTAYIGLKLEDRNWYATSIVFASVGILPYCLLHHILAEIFGNPKAENYSTNDLKHYFGALPNTVAIFTAPPLMWALAVYWLMLLNPTQNKEQLGIIFLGFMLSALFGWRYSWQVPWLPKRIRQTLKTSIAIGIVWLIVANLFPSQLAFAKRLYTQKITSPKTMYVSAGAAVYADINAKPSFDHKIPVQGNNVRVYPSGRSYKQDLQVYEQIYIPPNDSHELRKDVSRVVWIPSYELKNNRTKN